MTFSNKLHGNVVLPFYISTMEEKVTSEQNIVRNIEKFSLSLFSSIPLLHAHNRACCSVLIFFGLLFFSCSSKVMKIFFLLRAYRFFFFYSSLLLRWVFQLVFLLLHTYTHTHLIRFRIKGKKKAQSFMRKIPQGKNRLNFMQLTLTIVAFEA